MINHCCLGMLNVCQRDMHDKQLTMADNWVDKCTSTWSTWAAALARRRSETLMGCFIYTLMTFFVVGMLMMYAGYSVGYALPCNLVRTCSPLQVGDFDLPSKFLFVEAILSSSNCVTKLCIGWLAWLALVLFSACATTSAIITAFIGMVCSTLGLLGTAFIVLLLALRFGCRRWRIARKELGKEMRESHAVHAVHDALVAHDCLNVLELACAKSSSICAHSTAWARLVGGNRLP